MSEKKFKLLVSLVLLVTGLVALYMPNLIYSLILNAAILIASVNAGAHLFYFIKSKNKEDLFYGLFSLAFVLALVWYNFLPEWLIRVLFGIYCMAVSLAMTIQQIIYIYNMTQTGVSGWLFATSYFMLGFLLLFSREVTTEFLMKIFGIYFILLGIRYFIDAVEITHSKYKWRRSLHISLPTTLAALIPDIYLNDINSHFRSGKEVNTVMVKSDEEPKLKAMVHIGPDGFQKVGHFSFAYKGVVYSYGNYDTESGKLFGLLGDGVFFNVELSQYLNNITKYEKNTIFEYGIHITPEQEALLDQVMEKLSNNSYRWYSRLEREDGFSNFEEYESDYPSRLHYRTGAKFYKIKKGRLKTYWVLGENCVMFADRILGMIGADVLSIRGIITPGTYFDYLQDEYQKEYSPIVSCIIHPCRASETS